MTTIYQKTTALGVTLHATPVAGTREAWFGLCSDLRAKPGPRRSVHPPHGPRLPGLHAAGYRRHAPSSAKCSSVCRDFHTDVIIPLLPGEGALGEAAPGRDLTAMTWGLGGRGAVRKELNQ